MFLLIILLSSLSFAASDNIPESVPGEYVVKFTQNLSIEEISLKLKSPIRTYFHDLNIAVIQRPTIEIPENAIQELKKNPYIQIVEPNYIYRANNSPNDPLLKLQWGLINSGQPDSTKKPGVAGMDIGAEKAWNISTGSKDVIVAVIDSGVDYMNINLKSNIWKNQIEAKGKKGVDDDSNGVIDDIYGANFVQAASPTAITMDDFGHGTHCAGIIGAQGNDSHGVTGVAWSVRIMPVKFLNSMGGGSLDSAIAAVNYATKMGAHIFSNSWGGRGNSELLKMIIEKSNDAGALFVAAAGNDSTDNDTRPIYPASFDVANILSVTAIDNRGQLARFANYGKQSIDVAAPGANVYSTVLKNEYQYMSGTSMAAPFVAGAAVLLLAKEPELTALQIKERIMTTAKPLESLKGKIQSGLLNTTNMLLLPHQ